MNLVHVPCNAHSILHYPSDENPSDGSLLYEYFGKYEHDWPPEEKVSKATTKN